MYALEEHLYKEVYVIGNDAVTCASGELKVFPTFEEACQYLKTKNASVDNDLRVIHGVLTTAKAIPSELKSRTAFILIMDRDIDEEGIIVDSTADDNYKDLADEIEGMLEDTVETADLLYEIDDVFVVYGYEMQLALTVDKDEIDEEIIADCLEIGRAAQQLEKQGSEDE